MKANDGKISRRHFLVITSGTVGSAAVVGLTGGCGGNGGSSSKGGDSYSGEVAVTHLTAAVQVAPFHIADKLGYYEEADLQLELVSFPGGTETIRGMTTGMDFGNPATLPGLIAVEKGQSDLRLIAGAFNQPAVVFLVPEGSDIESVSDLANKKIGVSQPGSITNYFSDRIAKENGLKPGKDVDLINVGGPPDAWTAAKQGVVDVAWSNPPLSDKLIKDGEARILFSTADFVTSWTDVSYWTTQSFIDDSSDVLKRWLDAQRRAMETIKTDLDKAAEIYGERAKVDTAIAKKSLRNATEAFSLKIDMAGIKENLKAGGELDQLDPDSFDLDTVISKDFAPIEN